MSNGVSSATLTLPAGGTSKVTLTVPTPHVCQLPNPLLFPTARSFIPATPDNKRAFADLITRLTIPASLDHLLIVGHTDSVGGAATNQALSDRRTQAVQAVLQNNTAVWDTLFASEGWGKKELDQMVAETGGSPANRTDLFQRYFTALLNSATVPPIQATAPPLMGCGQNQLLHGSRAAPTRDTSQPPIEGEFGPNRRVEFFFFDSSGAVISCPEYPRWTIACSLTPPPPPTITVTLSPLASVGKGKTADVQVTINPSPLPPSTSITLTLSTTTGTGSAVFNSGGAATITVTASGPVTIRGVVASSIPNNIHISASRTGAAAVLAQEDFTVADAISIFLKFEVWDTTTHVFVPLPAGVDVDIVDFDPISGNDKLGDSVQTDAQGQVFFNRPDLIDPDETLPDIFFLVHTNSRAHAHTTLPPEWSTKGWKATDGSPGFIDDYTGTPIGSPPSSPRVFRIGLDLHVKFTFLNGRTSANDPIAKGISIDVNAGSSSLAKASILSDDRGEIHGLLFNISAGDTISFIVNFQMTDAAINLPRVMVNDPTLWNTLGAVGDPKLFPNNDQTSIGTQAVPETALASDPDRANSLFMLKVMREWSVFLFQMTGGAWTGVKDLLLFNTVILPVIILPAKATSFSFPIGQVHMHVKQHFLQDKLAHELTHQMMWKEADLGTLLLSYELFVLGGNLLLSHQVNLLANPEHALIEGWSQLMEAIFSTRGTPPYSVATIHDSSGTNFPLGPPPPGQGESVEGAFANALWAIFQNHVIGSPAINGHVPETTSGNIIATAAGAYLSNPAVRDRYLSMLFRPLQDLKTVTRPRTIDMIANIKRRNPAEWPKLHAEFQAFNLAMDAPTVTAIAPAGGSAAGGNTVTITGSEFTFGTTKVTIGANAATAVNVTGDTTLTAVAPPSATLGSVDVVVTTPAGDGKLAGGYLYALAPVLTSVTPARGPTAGRTDVVLKGSNFLPGATVTFGGVPATNVVNPSSTDIQAKTPVFPLPAHIPGGVAVVVTNTDKQTGSLNPGFDYFLLPAPIISAVTPSSAKSNTAITISGSNFLPDDATVTIGGQDSLVDRAASSATALRAEVPVIIGPLLSPGLDVRVDNRDGQFFTLPKGFTLIP